MYSRIKNQSINHTYSHVNSTTVNNHNTLQICYFLTLKSPMSPCFLYVKPSRMSPSNLSTILASTSSVSTVDSRDEVDEPENNSVTTCTFVVLNPHFTIKVYVTFILEQHDLMYIRLEMPNNNIHTLCSNINTYLWTTTTYHNTNMYC